MKHLSNWWDNITGLFILAITLGVLRAYLVNPSDQLSTIFMMFAFLGVIWSLDQLIPSRWDIALVYILSGLYATVYGVVIYIMIDVLIGSIRNVAPYKPELIDEVLLFYLAYYGLRLLPLIALPLSIYVFLTMQESDTKELKR